MSTWSSRAAPKRRKRSITIRPPRIGKVSGVWGLLTAVISLAAVIVQSSALIVTAVVSLLITIVAAFAGPRVAVQTRRASTEKRASAGGRPRSQRARRPAGTRPSKSVKCAARCRRSTAPKSDCECKSAACAHGSEARGAVKAKPSTPTRAELKSRLAKKQERQMRRAT